VRWARRHHFCPTREIHLPKPRQKRLQCHQIRPRGILSLRSCSFVNLFHLYILAINIFWTTAHFRYPSSSCLAEGSLYGIRLPSCMYSFLTDHPSEPSGAPYSQQYAQYKLPLGEKSPFTTFDRSVADAAWESVSIKEGCKTHLLKPQASHICS
jgi:hypothetical protein